ncbi:hypothetical protein FOZ60_006671, partial [Perkinsus olseni]
MNHMWATVGSSHAISEVIAEWHEALEEGRPRSPKRDMKGLGDPSLSFLYDRVAVKYGYVKREESLDLHIYRRGQDALEKKYQRDVVSLSLNYLTLESLLVDKSFCQNLAKRFLALLAEGHPELEDFSIDCGEGNSNLVDMGSASSATRLYYRAAIVSKLPELDLLDNKE